MKCPRCQAAMAREDWCIGCGSVHTGPIPAHEPDEPTGGIRTGLPWSEDEDDYLEAHLSDMSTLQIAEALRRTAKGVENRIAALGLRKGYVGPQRPSLPAVPYIQVRLSGQERRLLELVRAAGPAGLVASRAMLRRDAHISNPRRVVKCLESKGLLTRRPTRDAWWGNKANAYYLTPDGEGAGTMGQECNKGERG